MSRRILIWVQHLLGIGHFMRAKLVAEALSSAGHEVMLLSGGQVPAGSTVHGVIVVQLPAVRAKDELFDDLVDENGRPVSSQLLQARREAVLEAYRRFVPDCVITETFPFGRRLVQAELLALLETIVSSTRRPKLVASIRDVLQRPRKAERAQAMVDLARRSYDGILVHSDPGIVPAETGFPEIVQVRDLFKYTGYICRGVRADHPTRSEVLVSAGGGAVGQSLTKTAEEARKLSRLGRLPWTIVTGPLSDSALSSDSGLTKVRSLADFPSRLANAAVSVSQAGYNTMTEALRARTPTVVVPFETEREREQITRAQCFQSHGLVEVVRNRDLTPANLAMAIDAAADKKMAMHSINLEGQHGTVEAVREIMSK
ncbi:MAG: glycosyltransferase [Micropepsaceae bacterium]